MSLVWGKGPLFTKKHPPPPFHFLPTGLERSLSLDLFSLTIKNILLALIHGAIVPIAPPIDPPLPTKPMRVPVSGMP